MKKTTRRRKPPSLRRRPPAPKELKSTLETGTSHGTDPLPSQVQHVPYDTWGDPKD